MSHGIGHIAMPLIILQVKKGYWIFWFWMVFKLKISNQGRHRTGALRLLGGIPTKGGELYNLKGDPEQKKIHADEL